MLKPRLGIPAGWLLSVLLSLALPFTVPAQFTYITSNNTVTITGYTGGGAVTIPSSINGYPVVRIGPDAFHWGTLTKVTIPDSVISIENLAFAICTSLTNVVFGSGVSNIKPGAFLGSTSLTAFTADINNAVFSTSNGILFDKNRTTLVIYPPGKVGSYVIPGSVTSIGDYAFADCPGLTGITISNGVTSIGARAFYLDNLTTVPIPSSVTNIGNAVFAGCGNLTAITVATQNLFYCSLNGVLFNQDQTILLGYPAGLAGSYAIPSRVTSIGDSAFDDCGGLTNVIIPSRVTSIGDYAFDYCRGLTSIVIPSSVTNIGAYAFIACNKLTNAYFSGNAPSVNGGIGSEDNTIFWGESGTAYYLPGTTGWGSTFGGRPTALWYQPQPIILGSTYGLGATTNGFSFTISWATNASVAVEACTNLANPVWLPLATNTLANGTNQFSDPQWTNYPGRFYRLRSP